MNSSPTEVAVISIIGLIAVIAISAFVDRKNRMSFDPTSWSARPRDRWRFIHDLLTSDRLRGMSRQEVVDLLGNPDYKSDCSFAYFLNGDKFGNKLRIRLTADGQVFKAKFEYGCGD
jgi:hypothetical protein